MTKKFVCGWTSDKPWFTGQFTVGKVYTGQLAGEAGLVYKVYFDDGDFGFLERTDEGWVYGTGGPIGFPHNIYAKFKEV